MSTATAAWSTSRRENARNLCSVPAGQPSRALQGRQLVWRVAAMQPTLSCVPQP
ncbi:hypothetical protein LQZ44_12125 [Alcaligenes nematophilus]|uniref:hypothetical protein n=1 Tax=Alcaligenes nematophilus TaxID=2994643 RepID=UPI0035B51ECC